MMGKGPKNVPNGEKFIFFSEKKFFGNGKKWRRTKKTNKIRTVSHLYHYDAVGHTHIGTFRTLSLSQANGLSAKNDHKSRAGSCCCCLLRAAAFAFSIPRPIFSRSTIVLTEQPTHLTTSSRPTRSKIDGTYIRPPPYVRTHSPTTLR